mmetsp:Transcript_10302/g.22891  ORF Transcript_10302/g.22891 Transcript_10302/m.22891 type:complete len:235 (-) Transcript_10302:679-1383(-)
MGGKKGKDKSKKKKKDKDDDDDDDEDRPWYTRTWPGSLFALIGYICVFWSVLRCDFLMVYPNGPPKPEGGDRYLMVGCFCPMKPKPEENEKLEEAAAAMGADEVLYVATDVPGYLAKGPPLSDLPTTDNIAKPGSNIYVTMAWGGAVGSLFCGMISLIMSSLMAVGYASAAAGSCAMLVFMIHKSIPCAESISDRGTCQFGFGAYVLMAGVVLWTVSMFFTSFAFDWCVLSAVF